MLLEGRRRWSFVESGLPGFDLLEDGRCLVQLGEEPLVVTRVIVSFLGLEVDLTEPDFAVAIVELELCRTADLESR